MPNVLNTTATVSGKTLAIVENAHTVTGLWTFDRDPSAPYAVSAGSAMVANLDADKLDGQEGSYYLNAGLGSKWTFVSDNTTTGAQNNWAPGLSGHTAIQWGGAGTLALTGIAGGVTGQLVTFYNVGTGIATFAHSSASSSVGNRFFNIVTSAVTPVAGGGYATYFYNGSSWCLISHEQGSWVAYTPTWGNLGTANTLGNGTVTGAYYMVGRRILFRTVLTWGTTTVSGNNVWTFTYPTTTSLNGQYHVHSVAIQDASFGTILATGRSYSTTAWVPYTATAQGGVAATAPIIWTTSDQLFALGEAELT